MSAPRRYAVSGSPSREQLAAIVAALEALRPAPADVPAPPAMPAWRRAARAEGRAGSRDREVVSTLR